MPLPGRDAPVLVLGPVLRHVDPVSATVWVETDRPCTVEVLDRRAPTFRVGDHHYALVVEGLEPGSSKPYEVHLDGTRSRGAVRSLLSTVPSPMIFDDHEMVLDMPLTED